MFDDATTPPPAPQGPTSDAPFAVPLARPIPADVIAGFADPMLLLSEARKQVWADIGVLVFLLVAIEVTVGTAIQWAIGTGDGADLDAIDEVLTRDTLIPLLGLRAVAACAVVFLLVRHRRQTSASVGLVRRGWSVDFGLGALAPIAVYGVGFLVLTLLFSYRPEWRTQLEENTQRLGAIIPPMQPLAYAGLAITIGVYEELLFRGFLLPRLRRATGSWLAAVLISTAVFTGLHAPDQTMPALFMITLLSLVFSILTIWRRSIVPAIVAHTLWDLSQFLFLYSLVGQPQG